MGEDLHTTSELLLCDPSSPIRILDEGAGKNQGEDDCEQGDNTISTSYLLHDCQGQNGFRLVSYPCR